LEHHQPVSQNHRPLLQIRVEGMKQVESRPLKATTDARRGPLPSTAIVATRRMLYSSLGDHPLRRQEFHLCNARSLARSSTQEHSLETNGGRLARPNRSAAQMCAQCPQMTGCNP